MTKKRGGSNNNGINQPMRSAESGNPREAAIAHNNQQSGQLNSLNKATAGGGQQQQQEVPVVKPMYNGGLTGNQSADAQQTQNAKSANQQAVQGSGDNVKLAGGKNKKRKSKKKRTIRKKRYTSGKRRNSSTRRRRRHSRSLKHRRR